MHDLTLRARRQTDRHSLTYTLTPPSLCLSNPSRPCSNLSVIEQFGRFPERNALAGRKPRRAEQEYLSSNGLARQLPRDSSSVSLQTNLGRLKLFEASQPDGSHREGQPLSGVAQ